MDKARLVRTSRGVRPALALGVGVAECGCVTTKRVAQDVAGEVPIACDLTVFTPEERSEHMERSRKVFSAIGRLTEEVDGFTLTFTAAPELRGEVERWIEGEQRCCPFLVFDVTENRGDDWFAIRVSGPEGTKEILRPGLEALADSAP